ncbi:polycystin cation channel protein [Thermoplasmatales archaeon]|nr:polycystin cation channel protein [Thermoplasmatales archaeon]
MGKTTCVLKSDNSTNFLYKFPDPGSYLVTAKATNMYGSAQVNMTVVVWNSTPIINSLNISPANPMVAHTISLSSSVDWMNVSGNLTWEVDGKDIAGNLYTFNSPGNYTITLIATNQYGISSQHSIQVYIQNNETHPNNSIFLIIGLTLSVGGVSTGILFLYLRKKR